ARPGLDPHRLQADALDARAAAGGDDERGASGLRAVVERDDGFPVLAADGLGAPAEAQLDSVLLEDLRETVADSRLLAVRQPRRPLDDRHARAEPGEELAELHGDDASSDEDGARGDLAQIRDFTVRPVPGVREAR